MAVLVGASLPVYRDCLVFWLRMFYLCWWVRDRADHKISGVAGTRRHCGYSWQGGKACPYGGYILILLVFASDKWRIPSNCDLVWDQGCGSCSKAHAWYIWGSPGFSLGSAVSPTPYSKHSMLCMAFLTNLVLFRQWCGHNAGYLIVIEQMTVFRIIYIILWKEKSSWHSGILYMNSQPQWCRFTFQKRTWEQYRFRREGELWSGVDLNPFVLPSDDGTSLFLVSPSCLTVTW